MIVIEAIVTFMSRFATQLIMAILLFAPALKKRRHFWKRLIVGIAVYSVFPYAITGFGVYRIYGAPYLNAGWLNLNWAAVFAMGMLMFWACFKVSIYETLFYGTAAYAMQHCARNVGTIFTHAFSTRGFWSFFIIMIVGWAVFAACYFLFVRRIRKDEALGIQNKYILLLSGAIISIVYVLSVYVQRSGESTAYSGKIYAITCCVLLLIIQFSLFEQSKKARERKEIEQMLHSEQELQRISKENIEVINIKCHDLKHQIAAIRRMTSEEQREASLKDIENAVLIYDSVAKTGNDTLDLILSEKCLYCEKHNIKFSYIANIAHLDIISEVDLYSLLGNAIDNAIEEVIDLEDTEKRIISLNIGSGGNLLRVHIENYTRGDLEFENGIPITTKENKQYHGFGIKSIAYITDKYHGHYSISVSDNIFNLDILLPIK